MMRFVIVVFVFVIFVDSDIVFVVANSDHETHKYVLFIITMISFVNVVLLL